MRRMGFSDKGEKEEGTRNKRKHKGHSQREHTVWAGSVPREKRGNKSSPNLLPNCKKKEEGR